MPTLAPTPAPSGGDSHWPEHMRYLGCLRLLGDCSVYVPEELREGIERAMEDACAANPHLTWRRILNRIEIEVARDAHPSSSG